MITQDHERLDFSKVPQSQGIQKPGFIVLVIGMIGIFFVGGLSIALASYGHRWPSPTSMRMPLGKMPTTEK
jgi:hypothetical protein